MLTIYKSLGELFVDGSFYSKRLLVNYYANMAMLNYKLNRLIEAEKYGYLSLKYKTTEYLHYINTLCAILLKADKKNEALSFIRANFSEIKRTNSFYNIVGFVSFYVTCLNKLNKSIEAEYYADNFIEINRKKLFINRWHLFFTVYIQSLLLQEKYKKIIRRVKKYQLLLEENKFINTPAYYPILLWSYKVAVFKEVKISESRVVDDLVESAQTLISINRPDKVKKIIKEVKPYVPVIARKIKQSIKPKE